MSQPDPYDDYALFHQDAVGKFNPDYYHVTYGPMIGLMIHRLDDDNYTLFPGGTVVLTYDIPAFLAEHPEHHAFYQWGYLEDRIAAEGYEPPAEVYAEEDAAFDAEFRAQYQYEVPPKEE